MNKMSSASLNLCFSILMMALASGVAIAQDAPVVTPDRLPASVLRDASKANSSFLKPSPRAEFEGVINRSAAVQNGLSNRRPESFSLEDYYKDTPEGRRQCRSKRPKGDMLYYFFSFSMPEDRIRQIMKEAARTGAVMVLRGLYGGSIENTAKKLADIYGKRGYPVEIDPTLFDDFNIKTVPTILEKREGKGVRQLEGDVSLKYAVAKFASSSSGDLGLIGPTYPIEEENMLTLIYEKLRLLDWRKKAREIEERVFHFKGPSIPTATSAKTYYVDPSVVLSGDIKDHTGKVLFAAGTEINPADYVPLAGKYIVINGERSSQVKMAIEGHYKKIMVTSGDLRVLMKKYKTPFYIANEAVIDRFSISAIPSVISQEGRLIRVEQLVPPKK
jgi:conjugal transfer pilus assembly protein TraW